MKRLSPDEMAELALAALVNARRLFDDALSLRRADRLASAFLLMGLAADELGKHILVASFFGAREETASEWRKFWSRFRSHPEKLGNALWAAWVGDLLTEKPPPSAHDFHRRRLAVTYVDVDAYGRVVIPQDAVTAQELDATVDRIRPELEFCEGILGKATPAQLAAVLTAMRESDRTQQLRELLDRAGSMGVIAYTIALRSGLPHEAAVQLADSARELLRPSEEGDNAVT